MVMEPRRSRKPVNIAIGVLIAAIGVVGVLVIGTHVPGSSAPPGRPAVVATVAIPRGSVVTAGEVAVASIPTGLYPATAETTTAAVVGQTVAIPIAANGVITSDMLVSSSNSLVPAGTQLPIAPGNVAMAIPTSAATGVNNLIVTGDRIDLIVDWTDTGTVNYFLQDLLVISADPAGGELVVSVNRAQALELATLMDPGATAKPRVVAIVLRAYSDFGKGYIKTPTSPVPITPTNNPVYSASTLASQFGQ